MVQLGEGDPGFRVRDEGMTRARETSAAWSAGDGVRGSGNVFTAGGSAGRPDWTATETLSAAWLLPKDPASTSLRSLLLLLR